MHASLNCTDLHEKIKAYEKSVVQKTKAAKLQIAAKSSFGFGDVNGSLIFKKWDALGGGKQQLVLCLIAGF